MNPKAHSKTSFAQAIEKVVLDQRFYLAFCTIGLINALFYSGTISTAMFPSSLTGLRYGGEAVLLRTTEDLMALEKYPHHFFTTVSLSGSPVWMRILICLIAAYQVIFIVRGMWKRSWPNLHTEDAAYYNWVLLASLVLVGAVVQEVLYAAIGENNLTYFIFFNIFAFTGWAHIYYDILIPLNIHLPTQSKWWDFYVIKFGWLPFAALTVSITWLLEWKNMDFFRTLHLNNLLTIQLFAHLSYWILNFYEAWTHALGASEKGISIATSPAYNLRKLLTYCFAIHATYDQTNEYIPNTSNSNVNTALVLSVLLLLVALIFDYYLKKKEQSTIPLQPDTGRPARS